MPDKKQRKRWRKNRLARIEDLKSRILYEKRQIELYEREIEELERENAEDDV